MPVALDKMGKVHRRLENTAYAAIAAEYELEAEIAKLPVGKKSTTAALKSLRGRLTRARCNTERRVTRFDEFSRARDWVRRAMELVDSARGALREPESMRHEITAGAETIKKLGHRAASRVGKYIANRADGLVSYAEETLERLHEVADEHGWQAVELAASVVHLSALARRTRPWRDSRHADHLLGAWAKLRRLERGPEVLDRV